jgi:hypothetical protein
MARSMTIMQTGGALFAVLGIIGLTVPVFTTRQTTEVARIGDLKLQTQEDTSHLIPPLAASGALAIGIILLGGALYRRR